MMFVKVDGMVFLHLSGLLNLNATFLGWLFQNIELLLDLINGIIGHRIGGIHSNLQHSNVERLPSCCALFLTPSDLWTRCISELRHCWTVWYRLRGLWAYLCWNEHITLICFGKHFSNIVILNLLFCYANYLSKSFEVFAVSGKTHTFQVPFKFYFPSTVVLLPMGYDEK